jgi:hypothetical protein
MTLRHIADCLDWTIAKTHSTIACARQLHPQKLLRVVGYVHDANGGRSKDQSLYAAEAGEDKKRRKVRAADRRKATQARYRKKNQAKISAASKARRARLSGKEATTNPWLQLVPKEYRSVVTQIEQAQEVRKMRALQQTEKGTNV